MVSIGCVGSEKLQRDFVARTFALIAPVQDVLQQVSCSYETIPYAPKHYETLQKHCGGAANHSRVAEGTRLSPEGVYSGVS